MLVWDFPLRLFHWALVIAVVGAIGTGKAEVLWLHERFGLTVLGLVIFRILWGFIGGHYARFTAFIVLPYAAFRGFLGLLKRDDTPHAPGHSAIGGYAVIGLLAIIGGMAISGSMSSDDVLFEGPLVHLVPNFTNTATDIHDFGEGLLFLMLFLHLAAILVYKFIKRQNLTTVMIRGRAVRDGQCAAPDGAISHRKCWFGLCLMLACIAGAQAISLLRPSLF